MQEVHFKLSRRDQRSIGGQYIATLVSVLFSGDLTKARRCAHKGSDECRASGAHSLVHISI